MHRCSDSGLAREYAAERDDSKINCFATLSSMMRPSDPVSSLKCQSRKRSFLRFASLRAAKLDVLSSYSGGGTSEYSTGLRATERVSRELTTALGIQAARATVGVLG